MDFTSAIADLKSKAGQFSSVYNNFMSAESAARVSPVAYNEWQATKAKADAVKSSVSWVTQAIDTAGSWLDAIGLNGVQGLGAIPLIPIAAIVGASAALAYGVNLMLNSMSKIYDIKKRFDAIESTNAAREKQGLPPLSAADINDIMARDDYLKKVVIFGLVGLGAFYTLRKHKVI